MSAAFKAYQLAFAKQASRVMASGKYENEVFSSPRAMKANVFDVDLGKEYLLVADFLVAFYILDKKFKAKPIEGVLHTEWKQFLPKNDLTDDSFIILLRNTLRNRVLPNVAKDNMYRTSLFWHFSIKYPEYYRLIKEALGEIDISDYSKDRKNFKANPELEPYRIKAKEARRRAEEARKQAARDALLKADEKATRNVEKGEKKFYRRYQKASRITDRRLGPPVPAPTQEPLDYSPREFVYDPMTVSEEMPEPYMVPDPDYSIREFVYDPTTVSEEMPEPYMVPDPDSIIDDSSEESTEDTDPYDGHDDDDMQILIRAHTEDPETRAFRNIIFKGIDISYLEGMPEEAFSRFDYLKNVLNHLSKNHRRIYKLTRGGTYRYFIDNVVGYNGKIVDPKGRPFIVEIKAFRWKNLIAPGSPQSVAEGNIDRLLVTQPIVLPEGLTAGLEIWDGRISIVV
jgi:hypothetical protein